MKKTISLFLIFAFVVCLFSGCSAKSGIEITSCELNRTKNGVNGIFTVINNESSKADDLVVTVKAYNKNGDETKTVEGKYSLYVDPGHEATITVELPADTESAQAVSYSYSVDEKEMSGSFAESVTATFPPVTTTDSEINTREELAEMLIEDVEHKFMLQHFEAHGYYDKEKNQVIIASYATNTYDDCKYAYSMDPTVYNELAKSIQQMSLTCYEEFENYNFSDVKVSIGFMSSDEKIMISATNGEIVDNFS